MGSVNYSVLMSVYHREKAEYLRAAMDSIWSQTIPTDNFVLVCDGPLNAELDAVIEEMEASHPELMVIHLEKNGGLGNALNEGIKHCKNKLVARMDSDDISRSDRCERQLKVFETHPEIDICSGTIIEFRDDVNNKVGKRELPETSEEIRAFSRKRNPFNHPAVMFKKAAVESASGYDETYHLFEDYYLWIRMLRNGSVGHNLKEVLVYMRTTEDLYWRRGGVLLHFRYAQIPQMDQIDPLVILAGLRDGRVATCSGLHAAELHQRSNLQEVAQVVVHTLPQLNFCILPLSHRGTHSPALWDCEVA